MTYGPLCSCCHLDRHLCIYTDDSVLSFGKIDSIAMKFNKKAGQTVVIRLNLTSVLTSSVFMLCWLFIFFFSPFFPPCLFFLNLPWSLPFSTFGSSSKHPVLPYTFLRSPSKHTPVCFMRSCNALPWHPIQTPLLL